MGTTDISPVWAFFSKEMLGNESSLAWEHQHGSGATVSDTQHCPAVPRWHQPVLITSGHVLGRRLHLKCVPASATELQRCWETAPQPGCR